jgi:hypothetical protein
MMNHPVLAAVLVSAAGAGAVTLATRSPPAVTTAPAELLDQRWPDKSAFAIKPPPPVRVVPTIEQAPPPSPPAPVDSPPAAPAAADPPAPPDESPAPAKHVADDICSRHGGRRVDYRSSGGRAMWRCVYH